MGRFLGLEGVDAVVFDCDGVLVDSEPVSEWAWRAALAEHGVDLGPDFTRWIGTTDAALADHFAAVAGVSSRRLGERAAALFLDRLRGERIDVFEDAMAALAGAEAAGLRLAVGTNSERWRLDAILASARLDRAFTIGVTSDDVAAPKPAPDIYLLAVDLLGVEAHRCVVVEDSPTGVAAARAAGLRVVAIDRGVFAPAALSPATRLLTSLDGAATA